MSEAMTEEAVAPAAATGTGTQRRLSCVQGPGFGSSFCMGGGSLAMARRIRAFRSTGSAAT